MKSKKLVFLVLALQVMACGSSSDISNTSDNSNDPLLNGTVDLYRQEPISNLDAAIIPISNLNSPTDVPFFRFFQMGPDVIATPAAWQVGDFTGLYPASPVTAFQRGSRYKENLYGSNAVQAYGNAYGFVISPATAPTSTHTLQPAGLMFAWANWPCPWAVSGKRLVLSFDLQVPVVSLKGRALAAYVGTNFIMRDRKSGREFYYGVMLFDNRPGQVPATGNLVSNIDDCLGGCTVFPMFTIGGFLGFDHAFSTAGNDSAFYTTSTWRGFRSFEVSFTADNLLNGIKEANKTISSEKKLSENLADYEIENMTLQGEIPYDGSGLTKEQAALVPLYPANAAILGFSFRNMYLRIADVATPLPAQGIKGVFEGIQIKNGQPVVGGWACVYGFARSIDVAIYSTIGNVRIAKIAANNGSETAVSTACGTSGVYHRFSYALNEGEAWLYAKQKLYVKALVPFEFTGTPVVLPVFSGATTTLPSSSNRPPFGYLEAMSADGTLYGWALDPDHKSVAINVHVYVDGKFVGGVGTSLLRPDVNSAYGTSGNHGFALRLPSHVRDGVRHSVVAYGIDSSDIAPNAALTNLVGTFTLSQ